MSKLITAKIDVRKIDKDRLFKGTKGTYLDLILIPTPNSEYGDYAIKQSISKEERENGVEMPFMGNAKIAVQKQESQPEANNSAPVASSPKDDLPF